MSLTVASTATPAGKLPPLVVASLLATWIIWGSTYLAIKFALVSFPPFHQMGTRFLAAGVLLTAWMRWRGAPWPTRRQWGHAFVIGVLMLGGGMGFTAVAEVSIASGLVVAFIAVAPLMTALLHLVWRVVPSKREWAGILVGLVGVLMLVQGSAFEASPWGLAAIVVAVTSWTLGSALSQRGLPLAPGAMGYASQMLCGGAVLMAMSWAAGESPSWPPTPLAASAWLYLVVFGTLIAFNAYMLLLARASLGLATSYTYVNPVIAMILGVVLGGEVVTTWEWASAAVIVLGVVLLFVGRVKPKAA